MYHRVNLHERQPLRVSPARFQSHLDAIRRSKYRVISLEDIQVVSGAIHCGDHELLITFDDGYLDNYTEAWPALRAMSMPATVFVTAGLVESQAQLPHDVRYGLSAAESRLMNWSQVRELADQGISIGSHGMTHRKFTELTDRECLTELKISKELIEDRIGRAVDAWAYPSGAYRNEHTSMLRDVGYRVAFSTRAGKNVQGTPALELCRNVVETGDSDQILEGILRGSLDIYWLKDLRGVVRLKDALLRVKRSQE